MRFKKRWKRRLRLLFLFALLVALVFAFVNHTQNYNKAKKRISHSKGTSSPPALHKIIQNYNESEFFDDSISDETFEKTQPTTTPTPTSTQAQTQMSQIKLKKIQALLSYQKNAYVTMVTSPIYVTGALVLMESLRESQTSADLIVMVLREIPHSDRVRLCNAGLIVKVIDYIESPNPLRTPKGQVFNYSKLQIWLLNYNRVIFLEPDFLVTKNMDELFLQPGELLAVENFYSPFSNITNKKANSSVFNAGLMVIKPSPKTFATMMKYLSLLHLYTGGDQGFLNIYFKNWTSLPLIYNANKMIYKYDRENFPPLDEIKGIHFLRKKPWLPKEKQVEQKGDLLDTAEDYSILNDLWHSVYQIYQDRVEEKSFNFYNETIAECVLDSKKSYRRIFSKSPPSTLPPKDFLLDVYPNVQRSASEFSDARDITLITHLTKKDLNNLLQIANSWSGPISVVIYTEKFAQDSFDTFKFWERNKQILKNSNLHFVQGQNGSDYPTNFLRNVGMEMSETNLVFILDSNFIPSLGIYERLTRYPKYNFIQKYAPLSHCFVVPAFQLERKNGCEMILGSSDDCFQGLPSSKSGLHELYKGKLITEYHADLFEQYSTNTLRWFNEAKPYYTPWTEMYQPYVIIYKNHSDPTSIFDEKFYGQNKLMMGFELYIRGFSFVVLPDVFVVSGTKSILEKIEDQSQELKFLEIKKQLRNQYQCLEGKVTCGETQTFPEILPLMRLPA